MTNHHFDQISSSPAPHADRDASEGPDLLAALQGSLEVIRAARHRLAPHAVGSPGEDPMRDDAAVEASFVNPDGGVEAHLPDRGSSNRGTSRGPAAREGDDERLASTAQIKAAMAALGCEPVRSSLGEWWCTEHEFGWLSAPDCCPRAERVVNEVMALADAEIEAAIETATAELRAERDAALAKVARVEAFADAMVRLGSKTVPVDGLRRNLRSPITVEISPNALTEPADSKAGV